MQYKAANIGSGMDAKIAPNFPRIEKKIMNPADIWTTLRLPTCVKASKPAFSTDTAVPLAVPKNAPSKVPMPCQPMPRPRTEGGIIVALAYLDTAMKVPVDSIRATNDAIIIAKHSPASNVGAPH
jgi:hypothetical protein